MWLSVHPPYLARIHENPKKLHSFRDVAVVSWYDFCHRRSQIHCQEERARIYGEAMPDLRGRKSIR